MSEKKEKTVYVGITGDMIHPGIINVIKEGAKYGRLIVGLLTNSAIASHKRIPYLTYEQRKAVIENIKGVSEVIPQEDWSYVPNLERIKPDYIIHGDDWKTNYLKGIRQEVFEVMKKIGGEVIEIPYTKGINSSQLFESETKNGITVDQRVKSLKQLLQYKPIIRFMEANSGLSGLIIENLKIEKENEINRFDGIFCSSFTDTKPKDLTEYDTFEFNIGLNTLTDIAECTTKPIICGYTINLSENLSLALENFEIIGISAIILEDKYKIKSGLENKEALFDENEFCSKIKEGKKAQRNPDFMIIAGIEDLTFDKTVDEALKMALASVSAGADGILISTNKNTGEDIKEFCQKFRNENKEIPIVLIPSSYNQFTEKELAEWGANIIIYANYLRRVSYPAMKKCAETILQSERSLEANSMCMPIKEILNLIPGTN